ncbi:type II toxin-antitoxin system RelE/ParE family toxin [Virgibacillus doumboii]|uniref:type II toxin-antitoxin system RelE/ParE family toxin n=1 Tax=Virgibacillus doumboii TaxID=2697503 RepID=UPI0013DEF959|nr:type II toxin-antitoxin system RelE/ParE family toxin [Virgibacillus doumboii]
MCELLFTSASERYLKKIKEKPLKAAYQNAFREIRENSYIGQLEHGNLSGIYGLDVKYKGTKYEIAYTIFEKDDKKVAVLLAGTRENFYDELSRYLR